MNRVKPILRWPGGKSRMLPVLLPLIAAAPHTCYCEPFSGGLAVLLAKPRSKREVINDINGDLVALYLNVQNHLPEIERQLDLVLCSREVFFHLRDQPGATQIQRSISFLVRNILSFGGGMHSFGVAKTAGGGGMFHRERLRERLAAVHERLDGVTIEHLPYERCLKNQDGRDTLFFCDPPYLDAPTGAYQGWSRKEMASFAAQTQALKGKWIVTVNDSEFTREVFKGCTIRSVTTQNRLANNRTHSQAKFGELIVTP